MDTNTKLGVAAVVVAAVATGCLVNKKMKAAAIARARTSIDDVHQGDPTTTMGQPAELLYVDSIEVWVNSLCMPSRPSPALCLAARCQHLERWAIPRASFPAGREGYLAWRTKQKARQGKRAEEVLLAAGVSWDVAQRVRALVAKDVSLADAEMQILEDAACLVFLSEQVTQFSKTQDEGKMIGIIRKTWPKMSEKAHEIALSLDFDPTVLAMIVKALAPPAPEEEASGKKACCPAAAAAHAPASVSNTEGSHTTTEGTSGPTRPVVFIRYCVGCKWMLRAGWLGQELLSTFEDQLEAVVLQPCRNPAGVFVVQVGDAVVWDRKVDGGFPDSKELKRRVRDTGLPEKQLGAHLERVAS